MKALELVINREAVVVNQESIKVDNFLTQQVNPQLMNLIGEEFFDLFGNCKVTKVLTLESSGVPPAIFVAQKFGVPLIYARKQTNLSVEQDYSLSHVPTYNPQVTNRILISRRHLTPNDHILIIDNILAKGDSVLGMIDICQQAGATVEGVGIVIEKSFQEGRLKLNQYGFRVESLARIASLNNNRIQFLRD
ncbi:xanthine phosphoribosyltransferase [Vagococcus silagei]|uniref:Xanthine phosphoribosyltransferase n=1 Tax=Vagococcus silagei TaxID=2508885 RepID=A0A4S3B619_9ENTE|nr:xanthine phosphoribosyltransferase [Vagococcus silagei]THB62028.1 xanthine phosphoribosyltransferase [Vagococcus silagei]